jgi:hypothetical protein
MNKNLTMTYDRFYPFIAEEQAIGNSTSSSETNLRNIEKWRSVSDEVSRFSNLQYDWDGLNADAQDPEIVETALHLIDLLSKKGFPPPTTWIATPSGTVGFEWRKKHFYYEFEVVSPDRIEWMRISGPEGKAEHGILDDSSIYQVGYFNDSTDLKWLASEPSTRPARIWNSSDAKNTVLKESDLTNICA